MSVETKPPAPPQNSKSDAAAAGRGGLALSAAKVYFLALGLVQQVGLSWLLQDGYGALRGALSPASITYNPLISAGVQGMSWAVSGAAPEDRHRAIRVGLFIHAGIAVLTASGFFFLAPTLGAWLNSPYLVPAFRVLSLVVLFYGIYAPLVGVLNGQRRFSTQAAVDALAATLRTVALFAGAWWLLGRGTHHAVVGASWGFSVVVLLMFVITAWLVRTSRRRATPSSRSPSSTDWKRHLSFVLPVLGSQVVLNLLLQADTNTLRGFATRAATREGMEASSADSLVAAYNAGQLFGFLPYQLLIGITFILFPLLAQAHASRDRESVASYIRTGVRIALILTGAVVAVTSGISSQLIALVFPPQFAELGGRAMQTLTLGLGAFALFGVFSTVLNSLGRQWTSLAITLLALGAVAGLNWALVRNIDFGAKLLDRTALATSIGVTLAASLSGAAVRQATGALASPRCVLRVGAAATLVILVARQLPPLSRPITVLAALGIVAGYGVLLIITREVGSSDLRRIKALLPKR